MVLVWMSSRARLMNRGHSGAHLPQQENRILREILVCVKPWFCTAGKVTQDFRRLLRIRKTSGAERFDVYPRHVAQG
jgi:hypothetical protein